MPPFRSRGSAVRHPRAIASRITRRAIQGSMMLVVGVLLGSGVVAVQPRPARPQVSAHVTALNGGGTEGPGWDTVVPTGIGAEMIGLTWRGGAAKARVRGF